MFSQKPNINEHPFSICPTQMNAVFAGTWRDALHQHPETKPSPYNPQQTIVVRISLLVGDWTGGRVGIGFFWTRKGWNWVQGFWPGMNWKRHEESFSCFG
jgi:hypothetical protein